MTFDCMATTATASQSLGSSTSSTLKDFFRRVSSSSSSNTSNNHQHLHHPHPHRHQNHHTNQHNNNNNNNSGHYNNYQPASPTHLPGHVNFSSIENYTSK